MVGAERILSLNAAQNFIFCTGHSGGSLIFICVVVERATIALTPNDRRLNIAQDLKLKTYPLMVLKTGIGAGPGFVRV